MHRNGTLDYARLLAAFGIVFFHAGAPGSAVGYAALPFFLMILVMLAFPGAQRMTFQTYVQGRMTRLLTPWLIWSAVYGLLKLAELAVTGAPLRSEFSINMILTGTALHLWFLPFAFFTCLMIYPLSRATLRIEPVILALVMLGCGLAILLVRQGGLTLPIPFAQWLYSLPAVCLGIALAMVWGNLPLMLLFFGGFCGAALLCGAELGLFQLFLAGGLLILCAIYPLPARRTAQLAGTLSLGVYLAHPLVLSLLSRGSPLPDDSLAMALLGCLGGLLIAVALHLAPHALSSLMHLSARKDVQNTIS